MVDFNNETTIGTPAIDIVRVLLLQKREYVSDAWEDYRKRSLKGVHITIEVVKSRLYSLFLELHAYLLRKNGTDYIINIEKILENGSEKELWELTKELNIVLDNLKITKLDTRVEYDTTDFDAEVEAYGG